MPRFDKSSLRFQSSSIVDEPGDGPVVIDSDEVRVVSKDGRTIFTVRLGKDGRSIEVRCTSGVMIDGKYYDDLSIRPRASNVVELRLVSDAG